MTIFLLFSQISLFVLQLCYLPSIIWAFAFEFKKYFRKKYFFPVTNMNRQGEIIWLVFVAVSVAYLLRIWLAGSVAFMIATSVSLTLTYSDAL